MKKLSYFFALSTMLVLSGCGDDDSTVETSTALVGEWKLMEWYDDQPRDIDNDGNASTDLLSQWDSCRKYHNVRFNSGGTAALIYKGLQNSLACPPPPEGALNALPAFEWTLDETGENPILEFPTDDATDSYEILQLTSNTLVLKGAGFITCCDESISYYVDGYVKFRKVNQ